MVPALFVTYFDMLTNLSPTPQSSQLFNHLVSFVVFMCLFTYLFVCRHFFHRIGQHWRERRGRVLQPPLDDRRPSRGRRAVSRGRGGAVGVARRRGRRGPAGGRSSRRLGRHGAPPARPRRMDCPRRGRNRGGRAARGGGGSGCGGGRYTL